jgi:hypothetical protein
MKKQRNLIDFFLTQNILIDFLNSHRVSKDLLYFSVTLTDHCSLPYKIPFAQRVFDKCDVSSGNRDNRYQVLIGRGYILDGNSPKHLTDHQDKMRLEV